MNNRMHEKQNGRGKNFSRTRRSWRRKQMNNNNGSERNVYLEIANLLSGI